MGTPIATGEKLYTAFRSLNRSQRENALACLLRDREIRQDLFDLALIQRAKGVVGRPVEARRYFSRRSNNGR